MVQLTRRRLLGASAINGGGFLLASLVVLLWSFLMVRAYPGEASGQMLLALSVAGLINSLDLGVSMGLVRVISMERDAAHPYSPRSYFLSALSVTCITELLVGLPAVAIWKLKAMPSLPWSGYGSIILFALSTQAILLCSSALKGLLDFKAANLISTGSSLMVYGTGVAMALMSQGIWHLLLAMSAAQALVACAAIVHTRHRLQAASSDTAREATGLALAAYPGLLRISIQLFPQMFTGIFFLHAQRFVIARYAGIDAVAVISLAYSVATRLHAVVNAFLEVIFPMARQLQKQGIDPAGFCAKLGAVSAGVYLGASAVATVVASLLVPDAVPVLLVFSLGVTFAIASAPAFHLLNGSGASAQVSMCSVLSPLIFLGLAPALHHVTTLGPRLLLPTAYAATMAVMLLQVIAMVRRHSKRLALA